MNASTGPSTVEQRQSLGGSPPTHTDTDPKLGPKQQSPQLLPPPPTHTLTPSLASANAALARAGAVQLVPKELRKLRCAEASQAELGACFSRIIACIMLASSGPLKRGILYVCGGVGGGGGEGGACLISRIITCIMLASSGPLKRGIILRV